MKGMSLSMAIIIVVVVILIAAMVVLTIFGGQMGSVSTQLEEYQEAVGSPTAIATCESQQGVCMSDPSACSGSINYFVFCPAGKVCCIGGKPPVKVTIVKTGGS
jgi:hypothetical protein